MTTLRPEPDVIEHSLTELLVGRQAGGVERSGVEVDEALSLVLSDVQTAVDVDDVARSRSPR